MGGEGRRKRPLRLPAATTAPSPPGLAGRSGGGRRATPATAARRPRPTTGAGARGTAGGADGSPAGSPPPLAPRCSAGQTARVPAPPRSRPLATLSPRAPDPSGGARRPLRHLTRRPGPAALLERRTEPARARRERGRRKHRARAPPTYLPPRCPSCLGGAAVTQPLGSSGRDRSLPAGAGKGEGRGGRRRERSRARAGACAQVRERKRERGERERERG